VAGGPPAGRLGRAALLGAVVGMLVGGLFFLGAEYRRPAVDCARLPPVACQARRALEAASGRARLVAGCLLLTSALGFGLLLRREDGRRGEG
jgi:hypothetical protein